MKKYFISVKKAYSFVIFIYFGLVHFSTEVNLNFQLIYVQLKMNNSGSNNKTSTG